MPAMSTVLTDFADNGNSRTYTTTGHTTSNPKLVINSRRLPSGNAKVGQYSVRVSHATENADSEVIPERVSLEVIVRDPINGDTTDRDAVLAIIRDIIASDEFGAAVGTQNFLA